METIVGLVVVVIVIALWGISKLYEKAEKDAPLYKHNPQYESEWREPISYPKTKRRSSRSYSSSVNSNFSRMRRDALKNVSGLKEVKNIKARCFR